MAELINTTCSGGRLIITENNVIIKLGRIKEEMLPRAGLSVSSKMGAFVIYGPTQTLTFTSIGGQKRTVSNVPSKTAKQIMELLR